MQRISALDETVIKVGEIDDPLAYEPPKLIGVRWDGSTLVLVLDRAVNTAWVQALRRMGNYTSAYNRPPEVFQFSGDTARVAADEHNAQQIIDYFKQWLPQATRMHRTLLEGDAQRKAQERIQDLRRQRAGEERLLRVNRNLRV